MGGNHRKKPWEETMGGNHRRKPWEETRGNHRSDLLKLNKYYRMKIDLES
jgi:hypothetical protein